MIHNPIHLSEKSMKFNFLNGNLENNTVSPFDIKSVTLSSIPVQVYDKKNVICALSSHLYIIISADTKVFVFNEDSFELLWVINLDAPAVSAALSEDSTLLLVTGKSGSLKVFSILLKKLIWSREYENCISAENTGCIKESFLNIDLSGHLNIYVCLETNIILQFTNISVAELCKVVEDETSTEVLGVGNFKVLDLAILYPGCKSYSAFKMFRHRHNIGFIGEPESCMHEFSEFFNVEELLDGDIKADWEWNPESLKLPKCYEFREFSDKQKVANTKDGRYIVILYEKKFITVVCSFTHAVFYVWETEEKESNIINFTLHETINSSSSFVLDCKVGLLIESNIETSTFKFEIRNFPSFEIIHTIQLLNYVQLIDSMPNQDFWYILEGEVSTKESGEKCIENFSLKAISEAVPETRLLNLVNRKQFSEAEELAKISSLNCEVIHKTKITNFLNDICASKYSEVTKADMNKMWNDLKVSLQKIKDLEYIKMCTMISLPDIDSTQRLLFCIKDWVTANSSVNGIMTITSQVNKILNKLITSQILSTSSILGMHFKEFLSKDLLEYMISELCIGNLSKAFIIWERHKDEFLLSIDEEIVGDIMTAIPDETPSKILTPFLSEDFFPPVITKCPNSIDTIADWLINRVYLMELSEKDLWPENGKQFLTVFFDTLQELHKKENYGLMSFTSSLSFSSLHKKTVDLNCYVGRLSELLQKLNWLALLKTQFNCKVSLSDFQDSKMDVIFCILDRVDLKLVSNVINDFARLYALEFEFDLDICLEQYIKNTFQTSYLSWWSQDDETWEERLIYVIESIQMPNRRLNAALLMISRAAVPWSERVQKLVKKSLEGDHNRASEFEMQVKAVGLKEVLVKYDMKSFPINNDPNLINALVDFIFKQNKPSCIDDAKKVVTSIFDESLQSDVYYKYLHFLLNQNKLDIMLDVFESLSSDTAIKSSNRLLRYVILCLDDKLLLNNKRELSKSIIYVGIYVIEYLKKMKMPIEDDKLTALRSLLKLQEEYEICMTLSEILSFCHCKPVLESAIEDYLDDKITYNQEVKSSSKKHMASFYNITKIYRLGDILRIEKENTMGLIVTQCLRRQKYDMVLSICRESVISQPTQDTAETMIEVVKHFYLNFNNIKNISFNAMIKTIYNLCCLAVSYCKEDKIKDYIPFIQLSSFLFSINDVVGEKCLDAFTFMSDSYHRWKFYPLYQDEGFQLESEIVTNFIVHIIPHFIMPSHSTNSSHITIENNIMELTRQLVLHMKERGQGLISLRTLFLYLQNQIKDFSVPESYSTLNSDIETTVFKIAQNAISQRQADLLFAYNLIKSLPLQMQMATAKSMIKGCSGDLNRLSRVGKIGMEICKSLEKYNELSMYESIYMKTSLLIRKHIKSIPHTIILNPTNIESNWSAIKELITSSTTDLAIVRECCTAFHLSPDPVLIFYLNDIILKVEKNFLNNFCSFPEDVSLALKKVEHALCYIENEELVYNNFVNLKKKISPYSYEILLFIEEQLASISTNIQTVTPAIFEKVIELLKFLIVYKRVSPPTDAEIEHWQSMHPLDSQLHIIAESRLPFNNSFLENPSKIINPEVTANTLAMWLKIAPLLQLSSDHLVCVAVKNQVSNYANQHLSKYTTLNPDVKFISILKEMLEKINKFENSVALVSWVMNRMPPGGNKVICAKIAVKFAQQWYEESHGVEHVKEIYKKMFCFLQQSEIEKILHKHNLSTDTVKQMSHSPELLVEYLIETYSLNTNECLKVCKSALEITKLLNINFGNVILKFICKWLNVSQTLSANLDESFAQISSPGPKVSCNEFDEENKIKILNLLMCIPEELLNDIKENMKKSFDDLPDLTRARFTFCLVCVFGSRPSAAALGLPQEILEEFLIPSLYSAELHHLGFPYSLDMLRKCNKTELVQKVLSTNSRSQEALILCIKLCLEHNIWNAIIWETILKIMLMRSMSSLIQEILPSIQGNLIHLWHNSTFITAWNVIIRDLLKIETSDSLYLISKFYKTLLRCPCATSLNFEYLKHELKSIVQNVNYETMSKIESSHDISSLILIFKELVEEQFQKL